MPDLNLDDDLEGLSAEELEKLAEQDNGEAVLSPDEQGFAINGIDELNNPAATETPEPTETPESTETPEPTEPGDTHEPVPTVDYEAKYNETMAIIAQQKLLDDQAAAKKAAEPEDTRSVYQRAIEGIQLNAEEQTKYDSYKEYDEDQAKMYLTQVKQEKIIEGMIDLQEKNQTEQAEQAENTRKSQEQEYTTAINKSGNLKSWQSDRGTWDDVNNMHSRMLKNPEYSDMDVSEQMQKLEQRFAKFSDVESDTKPAVVPDITDKINNLENKTTPPVSLSSVPGGKSDTKEGRIKLDNSSDAVDIQVLMDAAAASDDPEAIDKLLSSVDFG